MALWTIYVQKINDNDIIEVEIDPQSTFLEFRKKAAAKLGNIDWKDLILASKKDYDLSFNSQKIEKIDPYDIYDQCTLMAVFDVNGGNFIYYLYK